MTGNPRLIEIIGAEIRAAGPITFARFMEHALYHPEHGFYASGHARIGRRGDFFTNVSVGSTFGRLLTQQFIEMWEKLGRPTEFTIVEQGAHDGTFARDVLEYARDRAPEFFENLRYTIVEPLPRLRQTQQSSLADFAARLSWLPAIDEIVPFVGIHFSNELFDAFPVNVIVSDGARWLERRIACADNVFAFMEEPISDTSLQKIADKMAVPCAGFVAEVAPDAAHLIRGISQKLVRGYVLAIDYGLTRSERLAEHRASGTLQIRAAQQLLESPFECVGEADITAHVDWALLAEAALESVLQVAGFCDQHHFLTGIVSELCGDDLSTADAKSRRALQTLLHPEMLGRSFQALILRRDAPAKLGGLRFAQGGSLVS